MSKKYSDNSIKTLDAREHVRLRVGNYTGGNWDSSHLLRECYYNAQDEHEIGNGNKIIVNYNSKTNIVSVEDEAQGFPVGIIRDDGKTVLQAAADTLNTSGKFSGEVYNNNVTGLNGQGLKITNFLSKYLDIYTANGTGKAEHILFKDGIFKSREYIDVPITQHGTKIEWKPDPQFFQDEHINITDIKQLFKECAALHPRLTIEFNCDNEQFIYHSEAGLNDLLNDIVKGNELLSNRFVLSKLSGKDISSDRFDIAMTYTSSYSEKIVPYVNAALTESGIHITTVKSLITKQINKYAITNNLLKKNDNNLSGAELSEGLVIVFNIKAGGVDYTGQAKEKVANIDTSLITTVLNNDFVDWLNNNPKDAKIIIDRALNARKAKEAAQNAKDTVRGLKTKKNIKNLDLPTKLIDANPKDKDRTKCILYCVEGDSAANGLISKRNGEIHGIMPLRGKILSTFKATTADIIKNQEIQNIVKALGLEVNPENFTLKYDKKKLRYNKIVLLEDGDADGGHIRMLLLTMFWRICPELVINGHIYSSRPPLYKITDKHNNYCYATDDKALAAYKSKHKNNDFIINRLKGYELVWPLSIFPVTAGVIN